MKAMIHFAFEIREFDNLANYPFGPIEKSCGGAEEVNRVSRAEVSVSAPLVPKLGNYASPFKVDEKDITGEESRRLRSSIAGGRRGGILAEGEQPEWGMIEPEQSW